MSSVKTAVHTRQTGHMTVSSTSTKLLRTSQVRRFLFHDNERGPRSAYRRRDGLPHGSHTTHSVFFFGGDFLSAWVCVGYTFPCSKEKLWRRSPCLSFAISFRAQPWELQTAPAPSSLLQLWNPQCDVLQLGQRVQTARALIHCRVQSVDVPQLSLGETWAWRRQFKLSQHQIRVGRVRPELSASADAESSPEFLVLIAPLLPLHTLFVAFLVLDR